MTSIIPIIAVLPLCFEYVPKLSDTLAFPTTHANISLGRTCLQNMHYTWNEANTILFEGDTNLISEENMD